MSTKSLLTYNIWCTRHNINLYSSILQTHTEWTRISAVPLWYRQRSLYHHQHITSWHAHQEYHCVAQHPSPHGLHCPSHCTPYAVKCSTIPPIQPRTFTMWLWHVQLPHASAHSNRFRSDTDFNATVILASKQESSQRESKWYVTGCLNADFNSLLCQKQPLTDCILKKSHI